MFYHRIYKLSLYFVKKIILFSSKILKLVTSKARKMNYYRRPADMILQKGLFQIKKIEDTGGPLLKLFFETLEKQLYKQKTL